MSRLNKRLSEARNGESVLFCGAGFTADCLGFDGPGEIGTGGELLTLLNAELKRTGRRNGFKELKNAASQYLQDYGESGLLKLLKDRFYLKNVSGDMVGILQFPWRRIYTTNYDNGIELALTRAGKKSIAVNNLDDPHAAFESTPVVHLHGYIGSWDISTFGKSCVLGAESYLKLEAVKKWLPVFRQDVERAEIVVFIGYNATDFHLNEVLFDIAGLKNKIFFVNRPTSDPDLDVAMTQERFGTAEYLGREGFCKVLSSVLATEAPTEISLSSFERYQIRAPSADIPRVNDIEDMFLFGKIVREQLYRDVSLEKSDYHVPRPIVDEIVEFSQSGGHVALLIGEICDGKSIMMECLAYKLAAGSPVFRLKHPYDDLLDEVSRIRHSRPNAILLLENCFDIREDRLLSLAQMFVGSEGFLILSSRSISAEAEVPRLSSLEKFEGFRPFRVSKLNEEEMNSLVSLIDQIAGWRNFGASTKESKFRFIKQTCNGSLPSFLLRLLKSDYVKARYKEELNKSSSLNKTQKNVVVVALYVAHIGHDVPISFLSNAFRIDVGKLVRDLSSDKMSFKLVHLQSDYVRTVPAIGATNILEHMIPDSEIVDSVIEVIKSLAEDFRHDDFERYLFGQLMRYSILRSVVSESAEIDRFFDNLSRIEYCRRQVLFWLQWHMAKTDFQEFPQALKFLEQSYQEAEGYEKRTGNVFNRKQLDDRKAKFLMLRAFHQERQPFELFKDIKDALDIVSRLFRNEAPTHHPFETLLQTAKTISAKRNKLSDEHAQLVIKVALGVEKQAESCIVRVPIGYQQSTAKNSLDSATNLLASMQS